MADRTYLDEASDTPMLPEALEAVERWSRHTGDPGRVHSEAKQARHAIEEAREAVAALVGARARDVTFTSSATEALNWLVEDVAFSGVKLIASAVEHSAVLDPARRAADERRIELTIVPVASDGRVDLESLRRAVDEAPGCTVFVQHSNHELGTIQPVAREAVGDSTLVVDAAQSAGRIRVSLDESGADYLVISGHKFGGPRGVGAIATRPRKRMRPLFLGGGQERARRAGAEDVAAIAGLGAAAARVARDLDTEAERQYSLSRRLRSALSSTVRLLGPDDEERRLPHIVAMELPGVEGEPVLLALDRKGFAVHSGSACSSEVLEPSHILDAVGAESRLNLRVSIGRQTSADDLERFGAALGEVIADLKRLAGGA